uniref:DUF4174 domain-containing protein n=1 Tax=Roseihalotalea indica TaxID=2867963 RepID=A0AA49GKR1_9BACT|nr:DUF4174 domain-containing protein [Tunicatimonas sp. TK19036]
MAQDIDILGDNRWKNRVLLIYADSDLSTEYQQQLQEIEGHRKGINERDIIVYSIFHQQIVASEGKIEDKRAAQALRQKYSISNSQLTIVLIGKDGGEKLTQKGLLGAEQLFGVIDQMPMRKEEMKESQSG